MQLSRDLRPGLTPSQPCRVKAVKHCFELGNEAVCWAPEGLPGGGGAVEGEVTTQSFCLCSTLMCCPGAAANSPHTSELNEVRPLFKQQQLLEQLSGSVGPCRALSHTAAPLILVLEYVRRYQQPAHSCPCDACATVAAACTLTSLAWGKHGNPWKDICAGRKHLFLSSTQIWWLSCGKSWFVFRGGTVMCRHN